MSNFLSNFTSYTPPFEAMQAQSLKWIETLHQKRDPAKAERISLFIKKFGVSEDKIKSRRSFIQDFLQTEFNENKLFSEDCEYNPNLTKRAELAQSAFEESFEDLYKNISQKPEHLLHVSCTHYESPSAAQKIVLDKDWETVVTHLYHMGCYAALPAVRTANALTTERLVDIVHTEICSLHLNADSYSPEQLVVQSLFADGAIKYTCSPEQTESSLEILSQHEILVPGTKEDMTWKLCSDRFDMTLSKNVPQYLGEYLKGFMQKLFTKAGLDYTKEFKNTIFAIHPGGPKIIDLGQDILELSDEQVKHSKHILKTRGNMSSATLPHIWRDILADNHKGLVATVAFGPGLTMTGALFKA